MASAAPGSATTAAAAATATADTRHASSAPADATHASTASSAAAESCACTNIAIMQLFHELKQQFPAVPDRVVSECISQNFHDKEACEAILRRENQGYVLHSYPSCLKMSSTGPCEPEGSLAPRVHAINLSGGAAMAPGSTSGHVSSPSCIITPPSQAGVAQVFFVNQASSSASSSTSSLFSQAAKSSEVTYEFSDAQTSIKRSENRWSSTHVSNSNSNSSTIESVGSETARFFQGASGGSAGGGAAFSGSSQTFSSQKETVSIARSMGLSRGESVSGTSTVFTSKPCTRPTTLNVGSSVAGPHRTLSAPAASSAAAAAAAAQFDPFHATQKHPASAGERHPPAGDAGVPYTGSYHHRGTQGFGSGGANTGGGDGGGGGIHQQHSASRENVTTSVYSDRTVVNSYQVNVNCSMRGGGSSSVNVTGSSSHTVTVPESPAPTVTTVSAPRPAPPPRPPPPQPKPKPRARSTMTVEPAPHYAQHNLWGAPSAAGGGGGTGTVAAMGAPQQPRSYTSVNLTLRPPSTEPQAPIDIQSAGTSLMYSTSSYDPRQGFQSKLQICIGPGGVGSVSAMRTRAQEPHAWGAAPPPLASFTTADVPAPAVPAVAPVPVPVPSSVPAHGSSHGRPPPPLPKLPPAAGSLLPGPVALPPTMSTMSESTLDSFTSSHSDDVQQELLSIRTEHLNGSTRALLERQLERKMRLQRELRREKEKLRAMQRDVRGMESDLAQRQLSKRSPAAALPQLSTLQKVQRLRQEIHLLTEECKKMTVEVDMSSDSRVPLGETNEEFYKNIYTGQQGSITMQSTRDLPRHRVDPPRRAPPPRPPPPETDREGQSWTCTECTFRNYWELEYCEQCEMPKLMLGTGPRPAPGAFCYCHPNPSKQLTPSVAAYPVYVPTPNLN